MYNLVLKLVSNLVEKHWRRFSKNENNTSMPINSTTILHCTRSISCYRQNKVIRTGCKSILSTDDIII